jgi:hypothetical protein
MRIELDTTGKYRSLENNAVASLKGGFIKVIYSFLDFD